MDSCLYEKLFQAAAEMKLAILELVQKLKQK
jgi:hypothetical protein